MEEKRFFGAEFIDDYRLLTVLQATKRELPSLVLIDTGKVFDGTPMQTVFLLSPCLGSLGHINLMLEEGVHTPSPAEFLAPFHHDPYQRIVALRGSFAPYYLVVRVGAFLKFGNRGESEIGWDEWKSGVAILPINLNLLVRSDIWISGTRLLSACQQRFRSPIYVEVYDFSVQGCARHLSNWVNEEFGGLRQLSSTGARVKIPWDEDVLKPCSSNDSLLFPTVSAIA